MADIEIEDDAHYEHLVAGAKKVGIDERNEDLTVEAVGDTNAHIGLYKVDKGIIDQSGSNIKIKGGDGKSTVLNRVVGCNDVEVRQDNTFSVVEATGNSKITAVNHITDTKNFTASVKDSVIRIKPGNSHSGTTAHFVIEGGSVANINMSGSVTYVG